MQANLAEHRRTCPISSARIEGPIPEGRVLRMPAAEDMSIPVQTQLIIELVLAVSCASSRCQARPG